MNKSFYVGYTSDLRLRLRQHNSGDSTFTNKYKPWELVYYEAYQKEELARNRESRFKRYGRALQEVKKRCGFGGAGFTLIELLVSVAIVMLVTGGVIVNYNTYNDAQKTRSAILTVKNNLRLAQSRAYNGDKPSVGCTQLLGFRATFTATTYSIQARCTEGLAGSAQSYTLESGNTFSPVPSDMLFRVLTQGSDSNVTVAVAGPTQTLQFTVAKSGDMSQITLAP